MTDVLSYPAYRKDEYNEDERIVVEHDGVSLFSRLSPFHVPLSVSVHIENNGACVYDFEYPNDESGERALRALPGDPDVKLRIGRHSGKIIEVHFVNAGSRFNANNWAFDPRLTAIWTKDWDESKRSVAERNVELISAIINTTPVSLRRSILKRLQRADAPG